MSDFGTEPAIFGTLSLLQQVVQEQKTHLKNFGYCLDSLKDLSAAIKDLQKRVKEIEDEKLKNNIVKNDVPPTLIDYLFQIKHLIELNNDLKNQLKEKNETQSNLFV